ncbi:TIGR03667 family PPOX class F420-dependent oxidoreductase [Mycobacterium sp. CVI_P3]|uniref:TIGR03667 family PPOX class F420-dependent oxidoreductase n=1 Tax=Mycobacterium pinniadriaticum TaxID=2994102 RepID=A0ABT3SJ07_9MYCO|nr:TIGR03667 family PPOX class F420-dependent oxidoreductase [Mycobacterium pinniadriaticum]MCX2932506.1 TIGR03667 family PPOX class F420-dependent oxidoreductase [Mycobacterium pinniadriaticum]MCX2938860.1 TIGR03667 family PPOX class F420-dependent oxidoreductase [Mycobacterium pinniadriaticum]
MGTELTKEVADRLTGDSYGWLTTVAKSGQPVPKLVWFYFDGTDIVVYTEPNTAKVRHIRAHPRVSLNLDSDGNGGGIIVIGGPAIVDNEDADPRDDAAFWAKYANAAAQFGLTDAMGGYHLRLRISIDKVWTTPTA